MTDIVGIDTEGVKVSLSNSSPVVIDGDPNVIAVENEVSEDTNQGLITPGNSNALSSVVGVFVT